GEELVAGGTGEVPAAEAGEAADGRPTVREPGAGRATESEREPAVGPVAAVPLALDASGDEGRDRVVETTGGPRDATGRDAAHGHDDHGQGGHPEDGGHREKGGHREDGGHREESGGRVDL